MPNATVNAYNKAVLATVDAADLMHVDDPEPGEEPLTPEQAKKRLQLKEGLRKLGGSLLEKETCPECGSIIAKIPRSGKWYKVCTETFQEDPACYWNEELPKEMPQTDEGDTDLPDVTEATAKANIEEEKPRSSGVTIPKKKSAPGEDAPKLTYISSYGDD